MSPLAGLAMLLTLAFHAPAAIAQDVTIRAQVDRNEVGLKDYLILEVSVVGPQAKHASKPDFPKDLPFRIRNSGSSSNFSFVNGRMESSVTHTYHLTPRQEGELSIAPITVRWSGQEFRTDPIAVKAVAGSIVNRQTARRNRQRSSDPFDRLFNNPFGTPRGRQRAPQERIIPEEHLEVSTVADRDTAWVGEQITLTFRMAISPKIRFENQPHYTAPEVKGAWLEALHEQTRRHETRGGVNWEVLELTYALFPTAPGFVEIGAAHMAGRIDARHMDVFSLMRSGGQRVSLDTAPLSIHVRALPTRGRPENFTGAVGRYRLRAKIDPDRSMANNPLTLTVVIEGAGNLQTVPEPKIPELEHFRIFTPEKAIELAPRKDKIYGTRTFTRLLVPDAAGAYVFPELALNYFDPDLARYRVARTGAIRLEILPDTEDLQSPVVSGLSKEEVKRLKQDIEYIHRDLDRLEDQRNQTRVGAGLWILATLPLLATAGATSYRRRRDRLAGDIGYARSTRALKVLEANLDLVRSASATEAPGAASRVLRNYIGDKLNINAAGLTTDETSQKLRDAGVESEAIDAIRSFLAACDLARYAPNAGNTASPALADEVRALATAIGGPRTTKRNGKDRSADIPPPSSSGRKL